MQTPNMARFFLASTDPHYLKDAPGGNAYLTEDADGAPARQDRLCRALRAVPLEQAAAAARRSRSGERQRARLSDRLERVLGLDEDRGLQGADAGDRARETISSRATILSTELRVPITLLGINACSPLATNAIRDNIWDNFSSESYKTLPSVGTIKIRHPVTGKEMDYPLPAGGRGYIRPASLVSLWSTAPFLQNNTVGPFEWSPSVEARMRSFEQSIEQMLWPERRDEGSAVCEPRTVPASASSTASPSTATSKCPKATSRRRCAPLVGLSRRLFPFIGGEGASVKIGPFPKGMPVGLITNIDLLGDDLPPAERDEHRRKLLALVKRAMRELKGNTDFGAALARPGRRHARASASARISSSTRDTTSAPTTSRKSPA